MQAPVAQRARRPSLEPPLNAVQMKDVPAIAPRNAQPWVVIVACEAYSKLHQRPASVGVRWEDHDFLLRWIRCPQPMIEGSVHYDIEE